MKKTLLSFLILLLAATGTSFAQKAAPFSGSLKFQGVYQRNPFLEKNKGRNNASQVELRLTVTPQKIAVDSIYIHEMAGQDASRPKLIYDRQTGNAYSLKERRGKKYGRVRNLKNIAAKYANKPADTVAAEEKMTLKATGQHQVIGGYHCQRYVLENNEINLELWMTDELDLKLKDLADVAKVMAVGDRKTRQLAAALPELPAEFVNSFPVRIIGRSKKDKNEVIMLDLRHVNRNVDPTIFDMSEYEFGQSQRTYTPPPVEIEEAPEEPAEEPADTEAVEQESPAEAPARR